jgi:hypothetical protein
MTPTSQNMVAAYRRQTDKSAPYVHIRKRCACGKVVKAIQLERFGACATCAKERRPARPR